MKSTQKTLSKESNQKMEGGRYMTKNEGYEFTEEERALLAQGYHYDKDVGWFSMGPQKAEVSNVKETLEKCINHIRNTSYEQNYKSFEKLMAILKERDDYAWAEGFALELNAKFIMSATIPRVYAESHFFYATLYIYLAEKALNEHQESEAWSHLCTVKYHLGQLDGLHDDIVKAIHSYAKKQVNENHARSGGETKDQANYLPLKQKAIELVIQKRPESGWKNHLDCSKAIEGDLFAFAKEHNIFISEEKTGGHRTLLRWLKEDPYVSAALKATSQDIAQN